MGFELTGRNYRAIDRRYGRLHSTVRNTMVYVFFGVTIQYVLGLGLATVLNQPFRGRNLVRVIFLMPMMITPVAAAYTGRMFFDSNRAALAAGAFSCAQSVQDLAIGTDGLSPYPGSRTSAGRRSRSCMIDAWQWIPFMTLILLAGMQSIPEDIYEAARVDGAECSANILAHHLADTIPDINDGDTDPRPGNLQNHRC